MRHPIDRAHGSNEERSRPLAPLLVDLTGRLVVVAGGGSVAERRVRTLLAGGADVRVIANATCSGIDDLAQAGLIELVRRPFSPSDAKGAFLLVAATDDEAANDSVRQAAAESGCLLNAAHDPDAGDVVVPAELRQGRLRITVSTSGASPSVARRIRDRIAAQYGPGWQRFLDALADARALVQDEVAASDRRHALLEALGSAEVEAAFFGSERSPQQLLQLAEKLAERPAGAAAPTALVSLVGAGPGDPGLITVRGLERVRAADVLVYDHLVDARLVSEAPERAELIYVGKRGGHHHRTQDAINELLAEKARSGVSLVVRLKGGDPFMFGRGSEEAIALVEAGIPFELVPGVTAGSAVPEVAGIPITHRGVASSVAFITGHEDPAKGRTDVDWVRVASAADTLCIFMGMKNLPLITAALVEGGRPAEQPVALVRWGTTEQQEVLTGTLGTIALLAEERSFQPPAIVVVGDVVALRGRVLGHEG